MNETNETNEMNEMNTFRHDGQRALAGDVEERERKGLGPAQPPSFSLFMNEAPRGALRRPAYIKLTRPFLSFFFFSVRELSFPDNEMGSGHTRRSRTEVFALLHDARCRGAARRRT